MFLQFCFQSSFITTLWTITVSHHEQNLCVIVNSFSFSFIVALFANISESLMIIIAIDFIMKGFRVFLYVLLPKILYNSTVYNYILVHLQQYLFCKHWDNEANIKNSLKWHIDLFMTDQNIISNSTCNKVSSGWN